MKFVFLDFDGVLNYRAFLASCGDRKAINMIDPSRVALVERLCREAGAQVVISSTWRLLYKLPVLRDVLRARGLTARVIGATPCLPHMDRGDEIALWLTRHGGADGIAILDDDVDMGALRPWLVRTSFEAGITEYHVDQALDVLATAAPTVSAEVSA